jgi:hypothetical protein
MAYVEELVDHARTYYDNLGANDAQSVELNARLCAYLTHAIHDIVEAYDWPFLETTASVTVLVGTDSAALPADFLKIGGRGGLFDPRTQNWMRQVPAAEIMNANAKGIQDSGIFAIAGDLLYVCTVGPQVVFTLNYMTGNITTVLPYVVATKDTPIPYIPSRYHYGTLLHGLILKIMEGKSDKRTSWEAKYQKSLSRMKAAERSIESAAHQVALARGGMC